MHEHSHPHEKYNTKELTELLKAKGLKATPLRLSLLKLINDAVKPLSAEEISSKLKKVDFDRATLFRNLKIFVEEHLCDLIDLGEGFHRYGCHHDHHHSHHIQCTSCKKIEEVDFCIPKEIERALEKKGYTQLVHRMDFFGLCKKCS